VRVRRDVAVAAEIPLNLEGEPPGAKEGGVLEQLFFTVTVEALPGNIPTEIVVDVSHLALGDQLHVADLPIPAGVTVQHEPDELVVQVSIPRGLSEEEEAAEGEEGVEGEEGAEGGEASASDDGGDGGDSEE
jgi:large subunit ribosomal protein L25